ncbi:PIF1-like helicase/AAA domain/Part of AAA domain containing protein [Novymonas esmeraldas]|uniref:ATP-dependent DNA helicase n=1 Tax=Novymonas esmeraldas TaxID=1808958 RepID=A0AAW0F3J2_9TRYP
MLRRCFCRVLLQIKTSGCAEHARAEALRTAPLGRTHDGAKCGDATHVPCPPKVPTHSDLELGSPLAFVTPTTQLATTEPEQRPHSGSAAGLTPPRTGKGSHGVVGGEGGQSPRAPAVTADAADAGCPPRSDPGVATFLMTGEQATVCDLACQGASLFIGGEAGTGKSYLLRAIAERLRAQGRRVAVTASTGIAALNIGGNTFHSTFGVPLSSPDDVMDAKLKRPASPESTHEDTVEDALHRDAGRGDEDEDREETEHGAAAAQSVLGRCKHLRRLRFTKEGLLGEVDVVIIDEVSMLHAGVLESFERAARRMAGCDGSRPFGGLQVILSGDFLQLTPFAAGESASNSTLRRRRRRLRELMDSACMTYTDDDRIVCGRVSPPSSDARPPPPPSGDDGAARVAADVSHGCTVDAPDLKNASHPEPCDAPPITRAGGKQEVSKAVSRAAKERRHRDLWYYDKPMFESWCFLHNLLHVELREPQRQQDSAFSRALNELRRGLLPHRLSRSAVLNAPTEDAVRLLPTKAAVRNYNDAKMLQLEGAEMRFATELITVDSIEVSPRSAVSAAGGCEAMLLVHYRFGFARDGETAAPRRCGRLKDAEAVDLSRRLEEVCLLPHGAVHVHSLPLLSSYSAALSAVCVCCHGTSPSLAEKRRRAVQNVLEMWPCTGGASGGVGETGQAPGSEGAAPVLTRGGRPPPLGNLFPRELVRVEAVERAQLIQRLRPLLRRCMQASVRRDTILQEKRLKVGCRVMLLRNLTQRCVNGSLGTVVAFRPSWSCSDLVPEEMRAVATPPHLLACAGAAEVQDDDDDGGTNSRSVPIPVVRMDADGQDVAIPWIMQPVPVVRQDWCFTLRVACMPLTPAYAFTVHKIQGVTLDHPVLFDAADMFPCDHLVYVAASRVRKFEQLRMVNLSPGMISVHKPSLRFTQTLPSVQQAAEMWAARKANPHSESQLFTPS